MDEVERPPDAFESVPSIRLAQTEQPGEALALVETVRVIEPVRAGPPALVQAAAAAATGFVAGAATVAVLSRRRAGQPLLTQRWRGATLEPHGETRTFLVQVRTLRRG